MEDVTMSYFIYLTDIAAMGRALSRFLLEFMICFESIFDFVERLNIYSELRIHTYICTHPK